MDDLHYLQERFKALKANAWAMNSGSAKPRILLLKKLLSTVLAKREALSGAIYNDYKRNPVETDLAETWLVVKEIRFAIANLESWMRPKNVATSVVFFGSSSAIQYEAKGVVLILAPWNFPINLTLSPLVSAIAAGNSVMIKPSEFTPNASHVLREIIEETFLPEQVCLLEGGAELSKELVKMPFNHIFFTGSPNVGKLVMQAAAENFASVTLELGGKTPFIVDENVNLKSTAKSLVYSKFFNAGQVCIAADFVFVHQKIADPFLVEVQLAMEKMYPANDIKSNQDYAHLATLAHAENINALLADAVEKGAKVLNPPSVARNGQFFAPILLDGIDQNMKIAHHEVFGPVLSFKRFSHVNEVISHINNDDKPLAIYVFSKSKKSIEKILAETSSGAVVVNETGIHHFNSHLPFGGINKSGMGKSHGHFGFLEFSNQKAVVKQWLPWRVSSLLHPPYTNFTRLVSNLLIKYFK